MKTENQKIRVREHLKRHGSITMLYAWNRMNIYRCSERIRECIAEGMKIKTVILADRTAKYVLVK